MNPHPHTRVVHLIGQDSTPFEEIFAVEDSTVLPRALEIIAQLEPTVDSNHVFQLSTAVEIVKADRQLVLLHVRDTIISHERIQVERMVDLVQGELNNLITVALPEVAQEQFRAAVVNVFTNLQAQQSDDWVHLQPGAESTTYQYNLVCVVQNQETGWMFYVAPVGLTITVDVAEQQLFDLTLTSTINYHVTLQALKIGAFADVAGSS